MNKNKKNYYMRVTKNGRDIKTVRTKSKRKFINSLRTINWKDRGLQIFLRINYGKKKDIYGEQSDFYNDGWYETEKDLINAFNAFEEED